MDKYLLSRREKDHNDSEWKSSTKGELDYILAVLRLNLESAELRGREYKIEPVEQCKVRVKSWTKILIKEGHYEIIWGFGFCKRKQW